MVDVDAYLHRLGLGGADRPSHGDLFALHRAHVARVPYENLDIQLGRPGAIDPEASAARIIAGRGGYCYHLNGAFALLLETLGYDVTRHLGGVFTRRRTPSGPDGGHMALTVRVDGVTWFVDVGLADALYEPVPLRAGTHHQGRYAYRLEPLADGGWRFWHDPVVASFTGMDFAPEPVDVAAFAGMHRFLSTARSSPFVAVAQVGRRTAEGFDAVRGAELRGDAGVRVLTSSDEWFGVLADVFGLTLDGIDATERSALWERVAAAHERYITSLANDSPGRA